MALQSFASSLPGHAAAAVGVVLAAVAAGWLAWTIYSRTLHPLAKYPGPFEASVTRLWLFRLVQGGKADQKQRKLHQKYGKWMRIAPNELALADPHAIQSIYGVNSGFEKTDFYPPWRTGGGNRADHFSLTDEKVHSAGRRIVQSMYSMSSVISCEPKIDNCMKLFLQRMTEYAESGEPIELEKWTQYYAFDAIGELYLSKMFGFMEKRGDFGGYMEALDIGVPSMALAGVTPTYLRPYLWKVLGMLNPRRASVVAALWPCIRLSGECVKNRLAQMHDGSELQEDFLAKLFRIKQEKGEKLNYGDEDIRREVMIALFAGSDTTNAALVSIFYHLMRTPSAYHALQAEVDAATRDGTVSTGFIRYNDAVKLPYLAAVIKEGMRIYPSVGLTLPRVAPPQGARISGEFLPGGTRVGINAAVIHYNEQVFGPEPEKFIPERWLRSKEQVELMDRCLFEFGAGSRTCIGKHISLCEMYKLVPSFLRAFDIKQTVPGKEWHTEDHWFQKPTGVVVRVTRRQNPGDF